MRSSRSQRMINARRGVLIFLSLVGVVHVTLAVAVAMSIRLRDPFYGDKAAKLFHRIQCEKPDRIIVGLGSSRMGMGFEGQLIEGEIQQKTGLKTIAFNFGVPGVGPITQLVYFNRLLASGLHPDLLIVELLPPLMSGAGEPIEKRSFRAEMVTRSELSVLNNHGYNPELNESIWRETLLFPTTHLRYQLLGRLVPSLLPSNERFDWSRKCDLSGWNACAFSKISAEQKKTMTEGALNDYRPILTNFCLEGGPKEAFEELLSLAQQQGIKVQILWMPEGEEFRSLYKPEQIATFTSLLTDWSQRYGTEAVVARDWLGEDAFLDSHHLLIRGAGEFSRKLTYEKLLPWLAPRMMQVAHGR
ncbi:DUF1574 family protein [Telmatocola sphagniphila]|uniref:DUF1574 family protein n=1 Tax=Telmatocola sphagniphila TaxID=1123043 RepID=A0A8E6B9H0_9BACT|nr:DUF1574 family protein [Telmatocola sphagniphila]QVL33606.1 DUF1574 family protein [Telmatocola sphagniphila]